MLVVELLSYIESPAKNWGWLVVVVVESGPSF
jgi:hypothetical protein